MQLQLASFATYVKADEGSQQADALSDQNTNVVSHEDSQYQASASPHTDNMLSKNDESMNCDEDDLPIIDLENDDSLQQYVY